MKLSEVMGDAPPTRKLSDLIREDKPKQDDSFAGGAFRSFSEVPGAIAEEFKTGQATAAEGLAENRKRIEEGPGLIPDPRPGLKVALGGIQELFAPISGAIKGVFADPIKRDIPGPVGEAVGNTVGLGLSMVGPSAVSKSLSTLGNVLPKYGDAVTKLMDAGVQLTPGQIARGALKTGEDALRSFPFLGQFIKQAEQRSLEDFNRSVLNQSLQRVGKELPKDVPVGPKAIGKTEQMIGDEYERVLPNITFIPDKPLIRDALDIYQKQIKLLPEAQQKQWQALLDNVTSRLSPKGNQKYTMDGKTWKQVDSELTFKSREYQAADDPDKASFGRAIQSLRTKMRDALERTNPMYAQELQSINDAWAVFERARGASIRRVKSQGVFSPADLLSDIRASSTRGEFARGDGLLQDLARAGEAVLPAEVPESGTQTRRLWADLLALVGAGGVGHTVGGELGTMAAGGAAGTAALAPIYTRPGIAAVNSLARNAPAAVSAGNRALRSPMLSIAAGLAEKEGEQ